MYIMLIAFLSVIAINEQNGTPQLAQNGAVDIVSTDYQAGGSMEGKEARFGIVPIFYLGSLYNSCIKWFSKLYA